MSAPIVVPRLDRPLHRAVAVPGSKSIANRALVCAALASGASTIANLPDGDDVAAMRRSLTELGLDLRPESGDAVRISGWSGPPPSGATVNADLAGTTSRFLVGLAALAQHPITVDGAAPLRARPFRPLFDALTELGVNITFAAQAGHLPATIQGPATGDRVHLRGDVSSQFISALMMIAPVCESGVTIQLDTELVSRPYVELTADVMTHFGAAVTVEEHLIRVEPGGYRAADLYVEPDASSASYPIAIAAVVGGSVTVPGLGSSSRQGDVAMATLLSQMGCDVTVEPTSLTVRREAGRPLNGIDVDMADISDLVPTVAAVAAVADSASTIRGVGFIRGKESDRLGDLAAEFTKLGVDIRETSDGLAIQPSATSLRPAAIDTHHDHRIAMSAAVLGVLIGGVEIDSGAVVAKSWPRFWNMLSALADSNFVDGQHADGQLADGQLADE